MPAGRVIIFDRSRERLDELRGRLEPSRGDLDVSYLTTEEGALEALALAPGAVVVTRERGVAVGEHGLCARARRLAGGDGKGFCYVILLLEDADAGADGDGLGEGIDDVVAPPLGAREIVARIRVGLRVVSAERSLEEVSLQLDRMASTDPMTGMLTRRRGVEVLGAELARVGRGRQDLTVLVVAIDGLERLCAAGGAALGDHALRETASRLGAACRAYDTAVRWSDDEFLLVFPHSGREQARAIAKRMLGVVSSTPFGGGTASGIAVTVSAGVATALAGARLGYRTLVTAAERALAEARRGGENHARFAEELDDAA